MMTTMSTWKECDMTKGNRMMNIPSAGLFLSRAHPTYGSCWLRHCSMCCESNVWFSMKKTAYHIAPEANILRVNPKNILRIFLEYGVFTPPRHEGDSAGIIDEIITLQNYQEGFKYIYKPSDNAKIQETMKKFNGKQTLVLDPQKKDFRNWCYVCSRLDYLFSQLHRHHREKDYEVMVQYHGYYTLEYHRIRAAGYDGIYFPLELFRQKDHFCKDDLYIRETLKNLGTDTLIIWNWCLERQ